ncbi:hypothetical protein BHU72_09965 [Desulfuribacillus stibiiarsenatis]|uniref:Uncharacterized protein n=1 Tax=Desulfuribacillus stibiiarsenatis TaxID=1390249 RepID=A0A1E5L8U3_9FIRM|nr:hypothetical protein [Desulfuribacillus stibiiarsenatis]OEH86577.1 hypothetical protein BHU72_09965 [Desulfuribacillus stibiiarsenatis]
MRQEKAAISDDIDSYNNKITVVEFKLSRLSRRVYNQDNSDILESFTLYRNHLVQQKINIQNRINDILDNIEKIKEVFTHKEHWIPILSSLGKHRSDVTDREWRMLVTDIVDSIVVKALRKDKYEIEINLKYELASSKFTYNQMLELKRDQINFSDIT